MISINKLSITSYPFTIKKSSGGYDLTTSPTEYDEIPQDEGIIIIPELEILDINEGVFYISQICKKHRLGIQMKDGKCFEFDSIDETYRDSYDPVDCHYSTYKIYNNKLVNDFIGYDKKVEFKDVLFTHLRQNWKALDYHIEFETWFQYSTQSVLNIRPILKFSWMLSAQIELINDRWEILSSRYSDENEIRKSVNHFEQENNDRLDLCELKHLRTDVIKFFKSNC